MIWPVAFDSGVNEVKEEQIMKVNTSKIDRVVRVVVGLALLAAAVTGNIGAWGYIGVVLLLTGLMGRCPAYGLLGINTCGTKKF